MTTNTTLSGVRPVEIMLSKDDNQPENNEMILLTTFFDLFWYIIGLIVFCICCISCLLLFYLQQSRKQRSRHSHKRNPNKAISIHTNTMSSADSSLAIPSRTRPTSAKLSQNLLNLQMYAATTKPSEIYGNRRQKQQRMKKSKSPRTIRMLQPNKSPRKPKRSPRNRSKSPNSKRLQALPSDSPKLELLPN